MTFVTNKRASCACACVGWLHRIFLQHFLPSAFFRVFTIKDIVMDLNVFLLFYFVSSTFS